MARRTCSRVRAAAVFIAAVGVHAPASPESGFAGGGSPPTAVDATVQDAFSKTNALAYNAVLVRASSGEKPPESLAASVMLKRAAEIQGIGWKISIRGTPDHGGPGVGGRVSVGFDGFSARSIRAAEKSVIELVVKDSGSLEAFLQEQGVLDLVPWELMRHGTIAPPGHSLVTAGERESLVSGEACEVAAVRSGTEVRRHHVARSDGLPRRIERFTVPDAAIGSGTVDLSRGRLEWTLDLSNVKRNMPIAESSFIVDVPDEFMVRVFRPAGRPAADTPGGRQAGKVESPPAGILQPGSLAPAWRLTDAGGGPVSSDDFAGKVVVLDFWGSWCPPCRQAMPMVQAIHERYKDRGVAVIGMNFERSSTADPARYMADNGFTYRLVRGAETIASAYRVPGWPTFYVIDRKGEIVWGSVGFSVARREEHEREIHEAIERALAGGL